MGLNCGLLNGERFGGWYHAAPRLSSRDTNCRRSSGETSHFLPCLTYRIFLERVSFRISHTETESISAAVRRSTSSGVDGTREIAGWDWIAFLEDMDEHLYQ